MKITPFIYTASLVIGLTLIGCSKHPDVNEPLAANQIKPTLQRVFQTADSSAREAAMKIADEFENHQVAEAYADAKELSAREKLTEQQRAVTIRAVTTIGAQLTEESQNGNQEAAATITAARRAH